MAAKSKIVSIVGARPNFMKIAPLMRVFRKTSDLFDPLLLHTGQHQDPEMSDIFFKELELERPHVHLGISGGTHAEQTGRMILEIEKVLLREKPDGVVVVGDVNSTLAGALCAAKLGIPAAHVEAGLRSFNRRMPEEVNRIIVDHLSSFLFIHEASARDNLLREGVAAERIHFVGNIMVDSLFWALDRARASSSILERFHLQPRSYGVLTLHRPENVDDPATFRGICESLPILSAECPIVWPLHPRTRSAIQGAAMETLLSGAPGIRITGPLGYLDFIRLLDSSRIVLTDSGGVQEEATALGIPCATLREETERPVTLRQGTNTIAGTRKESITRAVMTLLHTPAIAKQTPPLWDGRTAERIAGVLGCALRRDGMSGISV